MSYAQRNRQMQRQILNGPASRPAAVVEPEPVRRPSIFDIDEWPAVLPSAELKPTWWQVHRFEDHPNGPRRVLICQARSEDYALRVANCQKWRTVVTAGAGKLRPFDNGKPVKVIKA